MTNEMQVMMPPYNVEAEEAVIGGLMLSPAKMDKIEAILKPFDFYVPCHQLIFGAMLQLHKQGLPCDARYIVDTLEREGKLERAGGRNKMFAISNQIFHSINLAEMAALVKDKSARRTLIQLANRINDLAHESVSAYEAIDTAQGELFKMRERFSDDKEKMESFAEILPKVIDQIQEANSGEEAPLTAVPTGLLDLDEITNGGLPIGMLSIFAGRAAMGKTTAALEIGLYAARCGLPVLYFSMEMTKEQLVKKAIARISGIESAKLFQRNSMQRGDWENLWQLRENDSEIPFMINDNAALSIADIKADMRVVQKEYGGLGLVIVDYVGLMKPESNSQGTRARELDGILEGLRQIAKSFNTPILGLAQINRGVESRTDKRPTLGDIRDSGGFENEAALVAGLYRDEYYNPTTADKNIFELIVMKNRFGATGTVKLLFEPEIGRFKNLRKNG